MESGKQTPIENKLQRLEELLYQWKKDWKNDSFKVL